MDPVEPIGWKWLGSYKRFDSFLETVLITLVWTEKWYEQALYLNRQDLFYVYVLN